MSIIDEIGDNDIDFEHRMKSELELDQQIKRLLYREGMDDEGHMSELLFKACSCGQKNGFRAGFRIAVMLMAESFS